MQSKNVKMRGDDEFAYERLERRNYRYIQQLAKSLGLPSNFKKVYLVELIYTKKHKSDKEVNNIIHRVMLERLQLSRSKKEEQRKRSQALFSPPIIETPRRLGHMHSLQSPEYSGSLNTSKPKKNLIHRLNQNGLSSDRVLRSFSMKTLKPNYALLSGQEIKPQITKEARIEIIANMELAKCIVKKHKPNILNTSLKKPVMLKNQSDLLRNLRKRETTVTNLGPPVPGTIPKQTNCRQTLFLRRNDGSVTKLNAIIQRRDMVPTPKASVTNSEDNTQSVINVTSNDNVNNLIEHNGNSNYSQINDPNEVFENDNNENNNMAVQTIDNNLDVNPVHYDNNIKSEQVNLIETENVHLPNFCDVFSRCNNLISTNYNQPLYVQVNTEFERSQGYPFFANSDQYHRIVLETMYNFINASNVPLLQIATSCNTDCVYSTPVITTPLEQPSNSGNINQKKYQVSNESYICYDRRYEEDARYHDFLQSLEQNTEGSYSQHEDFKASMSSLESQNTSTAPIPEMVEDALELISQDGDYMDQMTMGMQVQCVFCSWAGPKIILENHNRKEHASHIERQSASTWIITCSLESISAGPLYRLVEHNGALYLFQAVYEDGDLLVSTLNSLSIDTEDIGSITIYNRISGEPFTWSGQIQPITPNFIYENTNSLKIELSRLDLLPNSANLRLLNRELVSDSTTKAVVGQPSLADILLILYVKIFN